MYREILVALESVEVDQSALAAAVLLARRSAARLHVVHVLHGSGSRSMALERSALFRVVEWTSSELDESVSFQLVEPEIGKTVGDQIIQYTAAHQIDLILMGTHARGRVGRSIYGSVVEDVMRRSPVPVLVVPRSPKRLSLRKLLIALDGSADGERILDDAAELAKLFGSAVTLLQVVDAAGAAGDTGDHPLAYEEFVLRCARSEEYLDRTAERLRRQGIVVRTATSAGDRVAKLLEKAALASQADVVGIAPRKRSGRRLPGRVSERVLHNAHSAVLLRPRTEDRIVDACAR